MRLTSTALEGVVIIEPRIFEDARGFFLETWNARSFAAAGLDLEFVQDNLSSSSRYTLRGIHYQVRQPQGKLVRVVRGRVFDVAVDLRKSSPSFGQWTGVELSEENRRSLWVPAGFGHGFLVMSERADFEYKCTDFYAPDHERVIRYDDPDIGIEWPLHGEHPILSDKDAAGSPLRVAEVFS